MTFDEYQQQSKKTILKSKHGELMGKTILAMGISGEAGEVLEKWKKVVIYKDGETDAEDVAEIAKEMGDVLWYLAVFAEYLGISLDDIAAKNLEKVNSRQTRGVIRGKGDNR